MTLFQGAQQYLHVLETDMPQLLPVAMQYLRLDNLSSFLSIAALWCLPFELPLFMLWCMGKQPDLDSLRQALVGVPPAVLEMVVQAVSAAAGPGLAPMAQHWPDVLGPGPGSTTQQGCQQQQCYQRRWWPRHEWWCDCSWVQNWGWQGR